MEVPGMDETKKTENHLISPVAFVEGGVQDSCDDACSICLEDFTDNDPSAVTSCKHEFHLQCILEWCQRSSQCPMCWQSVSLKDPTSQELLEAVEHERNLRFNPPRSARIFRHPTLGNLELPQLPVGANDTELEERILQHLAAAAAIGRTHHIGRREGQRSRSTTHGRSQFLVFSSHPEEPSNGSATVSQAQRGENEQARIATAGSPSTPVEATSVEPLQQFSQFSSSQADRIPSPSSGSRIFAANHHGDSFNNPSSASRSSSVSQDRAGPSDLHLFSESLKSRFNAVSMRYKESITKGTRGWKERLFSRSTSIADLGSEVRREVNAGIASVSRMMEHLETGENNRASDSSGSNNLDGSSVTDANNHGIAETHGNTHLDATNVSASSAVTSGPN